MAETPITAMEHDKNGEATGRPGPDRSLPRGLEQVSHLFISNAGADASAFDAARRTGGVEQPVPPRGEGSLLAVTRRFLGREQLASLLRNQAAAIEEGMRVIDSGIPCDAGGPIDLVGLDGSNHLAIIDLDDSPNDALLLRGIGHFDWMVRNVAILRRMYQAYLVDFAEPRLFLVAPEFSPAFRAAARHIASPRIHCLKYQAVGLPTGAGVFFESVSGRR